MRSCTRQVRLYAEEDTHLPFHSSVVFPVFENRAWSRMSEELLIYTAVALALRSRRKRVRSKWTKAWLLKRDTLSHINFLKYLTLEPGDWYNYLRMDNDTYLHLLHLVEPHIRKHDSVLRRAITPHERLSVTLRFLVTGRSYEDLKFTAAISAQALGVIIPETCDAIYKVLKKEYLKVSNLHLLIFVNCTRQGKQFCYMVCSIKNCINVEYKIR